MLQQYKQGYIEAKYRDCKNVLDQVANELEATKKPKELGEYRGYITSISQLLKRAEATELEYSLVQLQGAIEYSYEDRVTNQKEEEDAINDKYESLIAAKVQELQDEAKLQNQEARQALDEENVKYLALEKKRKELEQYAEDIIDKCALYGVTSQDVKISNESTTLEELDSLYDEYIKYMRKPKNRKNWVRLFREKYPDEVTQGVVLCVGLLLMFTPVLDILALASFIMLLFAQKKAQDNVKLYALALGLVYNVEPLSLGYQQEVDPDELVSEQIDEETDERISSIIEEWQQALDNIDRDSKEDEKDAIIRDLVNESSNISNEFVAKIKEFNEERNTITSKIRQVIEDTEAEFEDRRKRVRLLGTEVQPSVVFSTKFRLGLKDSVIEESIDIGLVNLVIRPCRDKVLLKQFIQVLLANALCNVRAGNLKVYGYDPNNFCQDIVSFYTQELADLFTFRNDSLDELLRPLKSYAQNNFMEMQGRSINEYNAEAERLNKVEKDYKLLLVLSQPKTIEEDEALTNFMGHSARSGVLVWVVSNKNLPGTKVFETPFQGIQHPYNVDLNTFGPSIAKVLEASRKSNKVTPLPLPEFINLACPDEKMWTYTGNKFIDIDPGLEDGDPSKFIGYRVGNEPDVHALAVGATGAGKSVFLNSVIATMCQKYSPADLELWLIDYKCAEFGFYLPSEDRDFTYPHIKTCLNTTDGDFAESVYAALDKECARRFALFDKYRLKNMKEYNELMENQGTPELRLPRIICINDEFQVIFETAKDKVLDNIKKALTSVAKLGRAAGVHWFFTSQSMNNTISGDVLDQFSLRFVLKCSQNLSQTILGTNKSADMKESRGFCHVSSVHDKSKELQKKYKIPLCTNEELIAHMKKLWDAANDRGYKIHDLVSYNEKTVHSIDELNDLYTGLYETHPETPETGLVFLGNRMTYDANNRAPENIIFESEDMSNAFCVFENTEDIVDFYRSLVCNISHFKDKPGLLVNAQSKDLHYVCEVEKEMSGELSSLSLPDTDVFAFTNMLVNIFDARQKSDKKQDPLYVILLGWETAMGFGIERDMNLTEAWTTMLKQCGRYGMHFIFIMNTIGGVSAKIREACKFGICGVCDEKSSYAVLDTKQGSQPSTLKSGFLYLKRGTNLPTRAKLYISPKTRQIKKSTFVM